MAWCRVCVLAMLAMTQSTAYAESVPTPIAIVVSASWPTPDEIGLVTLRRVYLGRITTWAGQRVERFELAPGSAARTAFGRVVVEKSEREMEQYWLEQALTGGAIPPREVEGIGEMTLAISSRSGAIGYLPLVALTGDVRRKLRVLALSTERGIYFPGEPGYPILVESSGEAAPERAPRESEAQR